jgi:hypothetical protein
MQSKCFSKVLSRQVYLGRSSIAYAEIQVRFATRFALAIVFEECPGVFDGFGTLFSSHK